MSVLNPKRLIFIHGLEGTSQGVKATLLRGIFPGIMTPDFRGTLDDRMRMLYTILGNKKGWTIIGSSFGGLMGALFTCKQPGQVQKLVLLAPALILPDFANAKPSPVEVTTIVYHGSRDDLVPLGETRKLAEAVFRNLTYHVVDDDHGLYQTVHQIDWKAILSP